MSRGITTRIRSGTPVERLPFGFTGWHLGLAVADWNPVVADAWESIPAAALVDTDGFTRNGLSIPEQADGFFFMTMGAAVATPGTHRMRVQVNGVTVLSDTLSVALSNVSSPPVRLAAGDVVTWQFSSSTTSLLSRVAASATTMPHPFFSAVRVGLLP